MVVWLAFRERAAGRVLSDERAQEGGGPAAAQQVALSLPLFLPACARKQPEWAPSAAHPTPTLPLTHTHATAPADSPRYSPATAERL